MEPALHYLDTNVLIAIIEPVAPLTKSQAAFLERLSSGEAAAVASEFALAECLVKPYAEANRKAIDAYLLLFNASRALAVMAVTREILVHAAQLRARSKISLPDAIHVATAEVAGCRVFVSEDRRIRPAEPMRLTRWTDFSA